MSINTPHLSRKEIVRAVVDAADLPEVARQHLTQCAKCQSRQITLGEKLEKLSQRAADTVYVSAPRTAAILAGEKSRRLKSRPLPRRLIPSLSVALLLCLISTGVFTFLFSGQTGTPIVSETKIFRQIQADETFAAEIAGIEAYALSGFTRQTEAFQYTSEEFINFVAPLQEVGDVPDIS